VRAFEFCLKGQAAVADCRNCAARLEYARPLQIQIEARSLGSGLLEKQRRRAGGAARSGRL